MGRNNGDFKAALGGSGNTDWEAHDRKKGAWRASLQREHGASVESKDRAESNLNDDWSDYADVVAERNLDDYYDTMKRKGN